MQRLDAKTLERIDRTQRFEHADNGGWFLLRLVFEQLLARVIDLVVRFILVVDARAHHERLMTCVYLFTDATSSAAPATATIAQMIGLGAGPTPPDELVTAKPEASAPTASVTSPKDSVTAPLASDSGLVTMPSNQDEPARSYGTQRTTTDILQNETTPTAPPQIYKPVELKSEPNNPWMKIAGGDVTAIGLVALAVSAIKLRTRIHVKRRRGVRVAV